MSRVIRLLVPATFALGFSLLLLSCSSDKSPGPVPEDFSALSISRLSADIEGTDATLRWSQLSCTWAGVVALRSDGTLWGWGVDSLPQDEDRVTTPTRIGTDSDWARLASGGIGGQTRAAIKTDGSLWLWGDNTFSLMGTLLPQSDSWSPYQGCTITYGIWHPLTRLGGNDWAEVSVSINHALAVKTDGSLWAWGLRNNGALGDGLLVQYEEWDNPLREQSTPLHIGTCTSWKAVAAGTGFSLGLRTDGSLWEWGNGVAAPPARVGSASDRWTAFAAGDDHALAIREDGSLWAWGGNTYGQLGIGSLQDQADPVLVDAGPWTAIAGGFYHSLGVKADGTLWAWGDNMYFKLGVGTVSSSLVPIQVGRASDWHAVACGEDFSCALKSDASGGLLWLWGGNTRGELGNGVSPEAALPAQVGTEPGWTAGEAGVETSFGLRPDGTLWGWGSNCYYQLGDGTLLDRQLPARVGTASGWTAVSPGGAHTLALRQDGSLWSWGWNEWGAVGNSDPLVNQETPARLGTATWKAVFAGYESSFAIRDDGSLWAWGDDCYSKLGLGNSYPPNQWVPEMIISLPSRVGTAVNWKQLSTSLLQTAAVREDGSLWSWGTGAFGSLGNGLGESSLPARVGTGTGWASVGTSGHHTAALKADGSLWTWGGNGSGELGNGTFLSGEFPSRMGTATWISVAVSGGKTVAVRSDGTMWGWGGISYLHPDDVPSGSNTPVPIGSSSGWTSVKTGEDGRHWIALKTDGTLWSWGFNAYGQLGNIAAWTPYPILIP